MPLTLNRLQHQINIGEITRFSELVDALFKDSIYSKDIQFIQECLSSDEKTDFSAIINRKLSQFGATLSLFSSLIKDDPTCRFFASVHLYQARMLQLAILQVDDNLLDSLARVKGSAYDKFHGLLTCAASEGDSTTIKKYAPNNSLITSVAPIAAAAKMGHADIVDYLLHEHQFLDNKKSIHSVLLAAATGGQLSLAKKLLEPTNRNNIVQLHRNMILRETIRLKSKIKVTGELIVNPMFRIRYTLDQAQKEALTYNLHLVATHLLTIPSVRSTVHRDNNLVLKWAIEDKDLQFIETLLSVPMVLSTAREQYMRIFESATEHYTPEILSYLKEKLTPVENQEPSPTHLLGYQQHIRTRRRRIEENSCTPDSSSRPRFS